MFDARKSRLTIPFETQPGDLREWAFHHPQLISCTGDKLWVAGDGRARPVRFEQ